MAYLGLKPETQFRKLYKQTITGNGGATYTLDYAVNSASELEVYVNNVRQEPDVAYTVVYKTLTMTDNILATDSFYVVYQGQSIGTLRIPEKDNSDNYNFDNGTLYVDASNNRVGLGTISPQYTLDIATDSPRMRQVALTGTNSSLLLFQNTGGSAYLGLDSSAGGLAGQYTLNMWHSGAYPIVFATNNTERIRIQSDGIFLVGKNAGGISNAIGCEFRPDGIVASAQAGSTNSNLSYYLYSTGAGAYRFYVGMGGTVYATSTTISAVSDQRFKENIRDLDVGLSAIMQLKPRKFDWKEGKGMNIKNARGFIAQEFEQVFPDLIDEWADPAPEGEEPYKSVRQDLIPVLVKAIQEQQTIIQDLRLEFDAYKAAHP